VQEPSDLGSPRAGPRQKLRTCPTTTYPGTNTWSVLRPGRVCTCAELLCTLSETMATCCPHLVRHGCQCSTRRTLHHQPRDAPRTKCGPNSAGHLAMWDEHKSRPPSTRPPRIPQTRAKFNAVGGVGRCQRHHGQPHADIHVLQRAAVATESSARVWRDRRSEPELLQLQAVLLGLLLPRDRDRGRAHRVHLRGNAVSLLPRDRLDD